MKKSIIVGAIVLLLFTTGCDLLKGEKKKVDGKIDTTTESIPLMQFENYKDIVVDNINSVTFIKYTEGGRSDEEITDRDRIQRIYNNLSALRVGEETQRACEDNTEVYVFNMKNDKKISIEIECDWLVYSNKRYEIK